MATSTTFIGGQVPVGAVSTLSLSAYNQLAHHTIIITVEYIAGTQSVTLVKDTAGNTYLPLTTPLQDGVHGTYLQTFYASDCLGNSSNIIEVDFAIASDYLVVMGWDISGAATTY